MPSALAIAAHPDDIEFLYAGTMLQLGERGWDLHYINLCDGSRGSTTMNQQECAATRLRKQNVPAKHWGRFIHRFMPTWKPVTPLRI